MAEADLLRASRDGDEARARALLLKGTNIYARTEERQTALHLAAKRGHRDITRLLLMNDIDIDASDENGNTALLLATKSRHKEVVRLLLKKKADIEISESESGQTALHVAAKLGDVAILNLLLKADADPETVDDGGNTAFELAERAGHRKVMDLLGNNENEPARDKQSSQPQPETAKGSSGTDASADTDNDPDSNPDRSNSDAPPPYVHSDTLWKQGSEVSARNLKAASQNVDTVAFSPDGEMITYSDSAINVWDLEAGAKTPARTIQTSNVSAISFSSDGQLFATVYVHSPLIKIWKFSTGDLVRTFGDVHSPRDLVRPYEAQCKNIKCVAFSPVEDLLATGASDYVTRLWKPSTGELVAYQDHDSGASDRSRYEVYSVAFSPDGQLIASGGEIFVTLWKASTRVVVMKLVGGSPVAFSPDGQLFAHCSWIKGWGVPGDTTLKLWRVSNGTLARAFHGHSDGIVKALTFSPGGGLLATAGSDRTVKLWETSTGELVNTLEGLNSSTFSVAFSPNGRQIASLSSYGIVKIWRRVIVTEI